jgi:hypothetical protein
MTGERFFNRIGDERSYGGAGARQHADEKTHKRTVYEGEAAILEVLHVRKKVPEAPGNRKEVGFYVGFEVDKDLCNREQTDAHDNEIDPI